MDNPNLNIGWTDLMQCEPRLHALLKEIASIRDHHGRHGFCANQWWVRPNPLLGGSLKSRMSDLVGRSAETSNPVLRSSEAYDVAYTILYHALPPCRNCTCVG